VRMICDAPWTGSGIGQFRYVFAQYRKDSARAANVLHPESDWLMVAAESGVPSALVLAALAAWFVAVCWKSRDASGGMLRWTAASAVFAAVLHGIIDVPWHRVSLGWFLLTVAAVSVPASGRALRMPGLSRFLIVLCGLGFLGAAGWLGSEKREGRSPLPYRWPEISKQLQALGDERRYEEAEAAAAAAVRQFPLLYESHYWLAGHLRPFAETKPEIDAAVTAAFAVEPVLAKVPAEHAAILLPVDPDGAMQAWTEAIQRAAEIDAKEGRPDLGSSGSYVVQAVNAFKDDKPRQLALGRALRINPVLLAHWITQANSEAASVITQEISDPEEFLDALSIKQRQQVLSRWIALPDGARVITLLEAKEALSADGQYWPVLARYYAAQGDLPRAVRRVASSNGISLNAPQNDDAGLRGEMAALIGQGNTVAARRLANDVVVAPKADADALAAAVSYFASQEDWPSAWKAASRLANETKIGQ
jgi:hypothetical protein